MQGKVKRRTIIVLCVLGAAILALTVALSVVCHSRALYVGEVADDGAYTSVMADIGDISAANPRVVDLAMLGSHNANTCNLDKFAGISGEAGKATGVLNALVPGLFYRYTKNQVSNVYSQLRQGVRFLQFRCSYYEGEWCGSHTLIDAPMRVYVQDVIRFLQEEPGEIVVLFFAVYDCEGISFSETIDRLFSYEYNGQTLQDHIPYENIPLGELRYNDVTKMGTKGGAAALFSLYHAKRSGDLEAAKSNAHFGKIFVEGGSAFHELRYSGEWYDRAAPSALAEAISAQCQLMREDFEKYADCLRIMQIQASPTAKDLWETAGMWSLVRYAKKHNAEMIENPSFDGWMEVMPIVLCDFVTTASGNFNQNINEKIMAYNRNLVRRLVAAG